MNNTQKKNKKEEVLIYEAKMALKSRRYEEFLVKYFLFKNCSGYKIWTVGNLHSVYKRMKKEESATGETRMRN